MPVFVRFWGVRGSIPTPGPRTRRYGGNTSCVELRAGKTLVVCDAGTGLRELGVNLLRRAKGELTIHLFLSHPHWDHIQGFPFFGPAYDARTTIYVYCPDGDDRHYQLLSGQMVNAYFPVSFEKLGAQIVPRHFKGTQVKAGDFEVSLFEQRHPGGSLGFRFEADGQSVVYATDTELDDTLGDPKVPERSPKTLRALPRELVQAVAGADLLVADGQYADEEYLQKRGWGHPRATTTVDLAVQADVKQLALTHHDPMQSDRDVDAKVLLCQDRVTALRGGVEVFGAREGIELKVG